MTTCTITEITADNRPHLDQLAETLATGFNGAARNAKFAWWDEKGLTLQVTTPAGAKNPLTDSNKDHLRALGYRLQDIRF